MGQKQKSSDAVSENLEQRYLKKSLDKFFNATENSISGISILDQDFNFIYLNQAATKNRGGARAVISSRNFFDYLNPRSPDQKRDVINALNNAGWQGELEIITLDNQKKVFSLVMNRLPPEDNKQTYLAIENDLTATRNIESKLDESENRYKFLFESSSEVLVKINKFGVIEDINQQISEYGYGKDSFLGRNFKDLTAIFPLESMAILVKNFLSLLTGHLPRPYEIKAKTKSGEDRYLEVNNVILKDKSNKNLGYYVILHDITERKQMEEKLLEEMNFTKGIIDTAQVIILVLDTEGKIVSYNQYMEKLSGYPLKLKKGLNWFETFLPATDRQKVKQLFLHAINDNNTKGNINPILTRKGELRDIEWYDKTLKNPMGKTTGLISIGLDVSERNQALKKLKESEEKYRTLIEKTKDIIYSSDANGIITYISPQVSIYGFKAENMVGKNFMEFIYPEDQKNFHDASQQAIITQKDAPSSFRIKTPGGEILWFEEESRFLFNDQGSYIGANGILRDITSRRQTEQKLLEKNQQLNRFNKLAVGRELRMIELKKEINRLMQSQDEPKA